MIVRSIHNDFRSRIVKEYKSVIKTIDKVLDRMNQRKSKHQKTSQDRNNRESLRQQRLLKEMVDKIRITNDLKVKNFNHDVDLWLRDLQSRIQVGKEAFESGIQKASNEYLKYPKENLDDCEFMKVFQLLQ